MSLFLKHLGTSLSKEFMYGARRTALSLTKIPRICRRELSAASTSAWPAAWLTGLTHNHMTLAGIHKTGGAWVCTVGGGEEGGMHFGRLKRATTHPD